MAESLVESGFALRTMAHKIPRDQLETLFRPFVRGDSARSISGTGLGLSILKRIVDGHDGEIVMGNSERGGLSVKVFLYEWKESDE